GSWIETWFHSKSSVYVDLMHVKSDIKGLMFSYWHGSLEGVGADLDVVLVICPQFNTLSYKICLEIAFVLLQNGTLV
ncbi:hypothetical protein AVEN_110899-1, partial [Araneus ventricosus]